MKQEEKKTKMDPRTLPIRSDQLDPVQLDSWVGQLLMVGISGTELTPQEKEFLVSQRIGGVVLFARNLKTPEQIRSLCTDIQNLSQLLPPFPLAPSGTSLPFLIGVDMEGGRVHRLPPPFTQWPSLGLLGEEDSLTKSYEMAYSMGKEMTEVGINLNFAPCADILTNPTNRAIGNRSLGSDPHKVGAHVKALIRGYRDSGILCCAKHFPGHGNTNVDSHEELPHESKGVDIDVLRKRELIPFVQATEVQVDFIMGAHILFEGIDPIWPASLSRIFLHQLLRGELLFQGPIVTDDLGMKAITKHHSVASSSVQAIGAGANLLLYCNEPEAPPQALESLRRALTTHPPLNPDQPLQEAVRDSLYRIWDLKQKL